MSVSAYSGSVSRSAIADAAKAAAVSPQISEEGSSGVMYVT
jgi:hypothetical protein